MPLTAPRTQNIINAGMVAEYGFIASRLRKSILGFFEFCMIQQAEYHRLISTANVSMWGVLGKKL